MIFLQRRTPAGVIDDDVNEYARAELVRGGSEFAKLVNAGGALIKFDECGIHRRQIQRGIRTAETAEARVSRRRRMHRQQMNNAAAELLDDVRQLAREVAEFSRRRQCGVALRFERFELRIQFYIAGGGEIFGRAEQPREGAINRVRRAREIRMHGNADIGTGGPMLPVFFVEQIRLGFEKTGFGQRQFQFPTIGDGAHRHIAPRGIGNHATTGMGGEDFAANGGGAAEICAQPRGPFLPGRQFFRA